MKAATIWDYCSNNKITISIHAAREGGDCRALAAKKLGMKISIHAAREGGDYGKTSYKDMDDISIHAAREGGDPDIDVDSLTKGISIHAAREGGDVFG